MNMHNQSSFRDRSRRPVEHMTSREQVQYVSLPAPARTVSSEALFDGLFEIGINHGGALYRLKITRQGKLILNK